LSLTEEDFLNSLGQKKPPSLQIKMVEYSPEEFAQSLADFYTALKEALPNISEEFAEKLTIEFCRRP
jgi:hypothetical protein